MGIYGNDCLCHSLVESKSTPIPTTTTTTTPRYVLVRASFGGGRRRRPGGVAAAANRFQNPVTEGGEGAEYGVPVQLTGGGKKVAELVGTFNELTHRIMQLSASSSRLPFPFFRPCLPTLLALLSPKPSLLPSFSLTCRFPHSSTYFYLTSNNYPSFYYSSLFVSALHYIRIRIRIILL